MNRILEYILGLTLSLLAVNGSQPSFTITGLPPSTSNIIQVKPFTSSLQAFAGVVYSYVQVTSNQSFFGPDPSKVGGKLVSSFLTECDSNTSALLGPPLDGVASPIQSTQVNSRWGQTKFQTGGSFTLCISVSSVFTIIPISISVRGMYSNTNKIYCMYESGVSCRAFLQGYSLSGQADAKLSLVSFTSGMCGASSLASVFTQRTSSVIGSSTSSETHEFGEVVFSVPIASYTVCYCPSYQAVTTAGGTVCSSDFGNFVQTVGTLILTTFTVSDPNTDFSPSVVYPRAAFDITVVCGSGGCSESYSPRIKFVDSNSLFNWKPYFDSQAGCRAALESEQYIGPHNCDSTATSCTLERSDSPPFVGVSSTFGSIQLGNELMNGVAVERTFDLCYCDSDCQLQSSWFRIGSLPVISFLVTFSIENIALSSIQVNVSGSINIQGPSPGTLRTSGTKARVMKLVSDNAGSASSDSCATNIQTDSFVTGYECYSPSSCDSPEISTSSTLSYGRDLISFQQAGWVAVCYCNENCIYSSNWAVVARLLIAGPSGNQEWQAYSNLEFGINITGYGLSALNAIAIVEGNDNDCTKNILSSDSVPSGGVAHSMGKSAGDIALVVDGYIDVLGGNGINIYFQSAHGLGGGDRVTFSGMSTGSTSYDAMLNSEFTVNVIDAFRVNINVQFPPGQFPTVNASLASWWRSNSVEFKNLIALTPGIFTVCWSSSSTNAPFSGLAGMLTVIDPPFTTGSINTTLAVSDYTPSEFGLEFTTSPSPAYIDPVSGDGLVIHLKLVFLDPYNFFPLLRNGSAWGNDSSTACSDLFSEFTSTATDFAQPASCFTYIDTLTTPPRQEIHMLFGMNNSIAPLQTYSLSIYANWSNQDSLVRGTGLIEVWILAASKSSVVEVVHLKPT